MNEWMILIWGSACATGVLLFLRVVALGLHRAEISLMIFERNEQISYNRRHEADIYVAEVVEDVADPPPSEAE